ncbi:hypothetical protein AC579_6799 [Pseudocercospora musae]|uniref:Uncharacterized protein n=1 Tax=Pseudocercospora musae TaxID=113226 RepID=A0A139IQ71_9PEZI|nr:hypothetical protein AC579_6799 [Pseudocercospora musae]
MIAPITTVFLSLLAFVAAQVDTDGATDSAPAFVFAPTSTSSVPAFANDAQKTTSTQTELDAPTTTAPSGTPSNNGPLPAPMTPVIASSGSDLQMPTSSPSATPSSSSPTFAFAPTTTSEAESSPSFAFAPTTSSMEFSFQPQTQSQSPQPDPQPQTSAPPPQNPVTTQTPESHTSYQQNTAIIASSETQLVQPTTTPEFTFAPSTTPTSPPAPVTTPSMSFTYNPSPPASTPTTPGNPVEQHPNIEQPGSSLVAPSPIIAPTETYLAQPSKSTITGSPNYRTIHVTQASNGNFMYGSHTLTNGAEITQGENPKFPTQIIELQSSSQLLIENAYTTRTQGLSGHPAPTTLTVRPLPPAYGTQSIPGGGYILSAAAEQEYVTLNGHTMAVSSIAVPTEKAITYKGHTVSLSGLTLVAKPTAAAKSSTSGGDGAAAEPSESSKPTMDSGVGRVAGPLAEKAGDVVVSVRSIHLGSGRGSPGLALESRMQMLFLHFSSPDHHHLLHTFHSKYKRDCQSVVTVTKICKCTATSPYPTMIISMIRQLSSGPEPLSMNSDRHPSPDLGSWLGWNGKSYRHWITVGDGRGTGDRKHVLAMEYLPSGIQLVPDEPHGRPY